MAVRVGQLLAERGAVVLCGGLGGVMEGVARGAKERGGVSVGLLPGADRSMGNPHLALALPTGLGELRNGLLVNCSDAVICVGGSWGTLSEVALAMRLSKPLVVVNGWRIHTPEAPGPNRVHHVDRAELAVHELYRMADAQGRGGQDGEYATDSLD